MFAPSFFFASRSKDRFKVLTGKYAPISTPLIHSFTTLSSTEIPPPFLNQPAVPLRFEEAAHFANQCKASGMTREEMLMKRYDDGGQRLKIKDEAVRPLPPAFLNL